MINILMRCGSNTWADICIVKMEYSLFFIRIFSKQYILLRQIRQSLDDLGVQMYSTKEHLFIQEFIVIVQKNWRIHYWTKPNCGYAELQ